MIANPRQQGITFTEQLNIPYEISFSQLIGNFNLIGYENGAYSTNANITAEALQKTFEMMLIIESK